jgi:hypothetical protein
VPEALVRSSAPAAVIRACLTGRDMGAES